MLVANCRTAATTDNSTKCAVSNPLTAAAILPTARQRAVACSRTLQRLFSHSIATLALLQGSACWVPASQMIKYRGLREETHDVPAIAPAMTDTVQPEHQVY